LEREYSSRRIRLNKVISHAGICARRAADALIQAGHITVNGQKMTTLGYQVAPHDVVKYRGQVLKATDFTYILLNKPKDYISTVEDPQGRKTVLQLVQKASVGRIYPVGRLDRNTTGLLLLTNDGALASRLCHPASQVQKLYHVVLDKPLHPHDLEKIRAGVVLEDGLVRVDKLESTAHDPRSLGLAIHMGRNRVIRRLFEHLDYQVVQLDRVMYAHLTKKDLPRGRWRRLTTQEVRQLKALALQPDKPGKGRSG